MAVHALISHWVLLAGQPKLRVAFIKGRPVPVSALKPVLAVFRTRFARFSAAIEADSPSDFQHTPATLSCTAFGGLSRPAAGARPRAAIREGGAVTPLAPATAAQVPNTGFLYLSETLTIKDLPDLPCRWSMP